MKISTADTSAQQSFLNCNKRGPGHEIVGISRTPERIQTPVESRDGDYDKPETLTRAHRP
jgi:hypothetical protein